MKISTGKPVRIWKTPVNGFDSWTVSYWEGAKRIRKRFPTKSAADEAAGVISESLAAGEQIPAESSFLSDAKRATHLCSTVGVPLIVAALECVKIRETLPGVSIDALLACYQKHEAGIEEKSVDDVINELLDSVLYSGRSQVWYRALRVRLGGLAEVLQKPINAVTREDIGGWFKSNGWTGRTRNNRRAAVAQLERFARSRKYLPLDSDLLALVPISTERNRGFEVFTPDEMRALLKDAIPRMRHYLAIAAFSGVRQAEILRLDWKDFADGWIRIEGGKSKTGARRLIPILPALSAQITDRPLIGPVWNASPNTATKAIYRLSKKAKVPWKRNALRHSFSSYRLADIKSTAQVAMECGNSERMIHQHYKELVTTSQAYEWFAIR